MALTHRLTKLAKEVESVTDEINKLRALYEQLLAEMKARQTVARRTNRRVDTQE